MREPVSSRLICDTSVRNALSNLILSWGSARTVVAVDTRPIRIVASRNRPFVPRIGFKLSYRRPRFAPPNLTRFRSSSRDAVEDAFIFDDVMPRPWS